MFLEYNGKVPFLSEHFFVRTDNFLLFCFAGFAFAGS